MPLRLDLYKDGVSVGSDYDWITDAWFLPGVCPDSYEELWRSLQAMKSGPPSGPICFYYTAILSMPSGNTPDHYRIQAIAGRRSARVNLSTDDFEIAPEADPFFAGVPTIYLKTMRLHAKVATESTPAPQPTPPPPPPPVPPTLNVNQPPATTDATYLSVTGTATPGAAVRLEAAGQESSTYRVGEKGTFMLGTTLAGGENHLKVTATKDGVSATFEATVTQAPKKEEPQAPAQPQVTVTTPAAPPAPAALPANLVSRAEFAQMMARAFHLPDAGMLALEVPNGAITRAEAALLAAKAFRLAGLHGTPGTLSFTDAAAIPYPTDVALAVGAGLATGLADGSFHPSQNLTRAEAMALVEHAVTLMGH